MTKRCECFSEFQAYLSDTFGVPYGIGEQEGLTSDLEIDDPWVICPNCDEPIYLSDCIHRGDEKDYWDCPACCCIEDDLLED